MKTTIKRIITVSFVTAALGVLAIVALGQGLVNGYFPIRHALDPEWDNSGIIIWEYPNHVFQTTGDFGFQGVEHGALFSGAFAGSGIALTNLASTAITAFTNTPPPGNTSTPVGWVSVIGTNGASYRVPLYQ